MKIKKGDSVIVRAGKDKGKTGTVIATLRDEDKVLVEGINLKTKHVKAKKEGEKGQRIQKAFPIQASNVMLSVGGKPVRVGYKTEGGKKVRIAKQTGKTV
jgi:large subunit ribosomal protein L24